MSLIPFEECQEALDILSSGKALSVHFVWDDNGPYKDYKDYYYDVLGFSQGEGPNDLHIAVILSEIGNQPHHYIVIGAAGKIVAGLHGDLFYVDTDDLDLVEYAKT